MPGGTQNQNGSADIIGKVIYSKPTLIVAIFMAGFSTLAWVNATLINPQSKQNAEFQTRLISLQLQMESQAELSKQLQNLKDNDLHSIEGEVKAIREQQTQIREDIATLRAVLDERLPAR